MKEGQPYQYGPDDIQRYIEGNMNASEMHALEKAALEDPFLADALEGFREMRPNLKEDLMEMQNNLSEKKQEERKRRWIPIAIALLLLLSFGGWLIFREDGAGTGDGQQQIAKVDVSNSENDEAAKALQDSQSLVKNDAAKADAATTKAARDANEDLAATKPDNTKAEESERAEVASNKAAKTAEETASAPAAAETAPAPTAAPKAAPLANVDAAAKKDNESGKKTLSAPSKANPAEAKTAVPAARAKGGYQFDLLEMAKNVEPVTGWSAFAKYIQSNMQRPAGGLHGTVGTNFVVAPDGTISDITVVKSLHPDYDKEAVRLLQNGPKWKASNGGDKPLKAVYNVVF